MAKKKTLSAPSVGDFIQVDDRKLKITNVLEGIEEKDIFSRGFCKSPHGKRKFAWIMDLTGEIRVIYRFGVRAEKDDKFTLIRSS